MADLKDEIAALRNEVERLKAIEAIRRNMYIYTLLMDFALYEQVLELFTEDATVEVGGRGVYVGPEQRRKLWMEIWGPAYGGANNMLDAGTIIWHHAFSGIVEVSDDLKTATSRFKYDGAVGKYGIGWTSKQYGNYFLEWRRDDNGVWWISKLHLAFFAMAAGGDFIENLSYGGRVSHDIPPDRPMTFHHPFPEVTTHPWQFNHPTTGKPLPEYVRPERFWRGNVPAEHGAPNSGEIIPEGDAEIRELAAKSGIVGDRTMFSRK